MDPATIIPGLSLQRAALQSRHLPAAATSR